MRGRIVSFSGADGLGNVQLEDGRVVRFGVKECGGLPPVTGLEVEVPEVVPGRLPGQLRASQLVLSTDLARLPWCEGRIATYDEGTGEGTVVFDDARTATFSGGTHGHMRRVPEPQLAVRVRVAGSAVIEMDEATPLPTPAEALARAQNEGLGREITKQDLRKIREDLGDDPDQPAPGFHVILEEWYATHLELARRDGWINHDVDFLNDVEDPIAELAACSGRAPLLELVRMEDFDSDAAGHMEDLLRVTVRSPGGAVEECFEARSYADIVERYNAALAAAGASYRFYSLDTQGDYFVYVRLEPAGAQRLADARVLPFDDF